MEKPEQHQFKAEQKEEDEKSPSSEEIEEEQVVEEVGLRVRLPRNGFSSTTTTTTTTTTTSTYATGNGNGDATPPSELENGAGSEDQLVVEEQQEELQNGFAEEDNNGTVTEIKPVNGHQSSERNIYYDQDDGAESVESVHEFVGEEHGGGLRSDPERDANLHVMGKHYENGNSLSTVTNHNYQEDIVENNNSLSDFGPLPSSEETNASHKTSNNNEIVKDVDTDLVKEDDDQDATDYDVERVLEQQETHDLYCPNCNSCITKRVILRKRKRKIRNTDEEAKRNRSETVVQSRLDATYDQGPDTVDISLDGSPATGATDINNDRETDVFRCLSCFSFFIPSGSCFNIFRRSEDKSESEKLLIAREEPSVPWFSSIFSSSKQEVSIQQGSQQTAVAGKSKVGATVPPVNLNNQSGQASSFQDSSSTKFSSSGALGKSDITESPVVGSNFVSSSKQGAELVGNAAVNATFVGTGGATLDQSDFNIFNQFKSSSSSSKLPCDDAFNNPVAQLAGRTPTNNGEQAENASLIPQQNGFNLQVPSNVDSFVLDISKTDQKLTVEKRNADMDGKTRFLTGGNDQNGGASFLFESVTKEENTNFKKSDKDGSYQYEVSQHSVTETTVNFYKEDSSLNAEAHALSPSIQDVLLLDDRRADIINGFKEMHAAESNAGDAVKETKILVEDMLLERAPPPERVSNFVSSAESGTSPHTEVQIQSGVQNVTETREAYGVEIIKSIVYGGLIETITSLGVVSSAAGADAATLNILALGMANMIGGLFIIGHNLVELKENQSEITNPPNDRYQEQLGRRKNFWLHAIVAVLSFLVFGLLPPVIYGFAYRKSDNRDYKLIAVGGASLVCIIVLAIAKTAYVERGPKSYVKMVTYYVIMGVMASGVSYVAGDLINKLMEELGWFPQSSPMPNTPLELHPWQSY